MAGVSGDYLDNDYDVVFGPDMEAGLAAIFVVVPLIGIILNTLFLTIMVIVFGLKRYQNILWMNLSLALAVVAISNIVDVCTWQNSFFTTGYIMCRILQAYISAGPMISKGCCLMLLFERTIAVHLPIFYSFYPQMATTNILYGWIFGIGSTILSLFEIFPSLNVYRCKGAFHIQVPAEPVRLLLFCLTAFIWLLSAIGNLYTPHASKSLAAASLKVEMRGTSLVLRTAFALMVCWLPKQVIVILFWMGKIDSAQFHIFGTFSDAFGLFASWIPFLINLQRNEFYASVKKLFTDRDFEPIRRKLHMQESYVITAHKLAIEERGHKAEHHTTTPSKDTEAKEKHPHQSITSQPLKARDVIQVDLASVPKARTVEKVATPPPEKVLCVKKSKSTELY